MKWNDLASFKKKFASPPRLFLLIAKEEEEKKAILAELLTSWQRGREVALLGEAEGNDFSKEVDTLPFLAKERLVILEKFDGLSQDAKKRAAAYVKKPNHWISFFLISKGIDQKQEIYQTILQQGELLDLAGGKPWEKEPELVRWLLHECEERRVKMSQKVAISLVRGLGGQRLLLRNELEKLLTYIGSKGEITADDLRALVHPISHETLWELGEAIFSFDAKRAIEIGETLEENGEMFLLMSHLRTQMRNALLALCAYESGGFSAVTEAFPYLKGGLLEKKISLFQGYSKKRLKQGLLLLFDLELKAKEGEVPCLLEQLIFQLATRQL